MGINIVSNNYSSTGDMQSRSKVSAHMTLEELQASANIAKELDEDALECIASCVMEGIDNDLASRRGWEDDIDEWLKLASQIREKKSFPWEDSANVKYPILTIAATQFAARAYSALLSGPNYAQGRAIGADLEGTKQAKAIKIGKHMSYQLKEEMVDWEEDFDRLLHTLPITGTAFKKTYYNPALGHNVSEFVSPKDLIINYHAKNVETAYRKTHILYYNTNELLGMIRAGVYLDYSDSKDVNKRQGFAGFPIPTAEAQKTNADSSQNIRANAPDAATSHTMYESHTWYDLDGDGYEEPYIITIHKETAKVVRIVAGISPLDDAIQYNENQEVSLIKQKQYFTGFRFIPDPNSGVYGLGFGSLLGPLNISINTIINQLLDAGTLSNMQSGFLAANMQPQGGDMSFQPGEWKIVNAYGSDIKSGIVPLPVREPSNVLFSLLGLLEGASMKMASVVDILTGEIPGQNTKATVAMAAIEQGLKVFSSIYKRCHTSLKKEYAKLYEINAEYLPAEQYVSIFVSDNEDAIDIQQSDYILGDNDVIPYSDPNVSSEQQRLVKVQVIGDLLQLGTINVQEYTRRYLEATDQPSIETLMQLPEPQPDPAVVLQTQEFAHKQAMDIWEMKLKSLEVDIKANQARVKAVLDLAKAEGEEVGNNLSQYNAEVDQLFKQEDLLLANKRQLLDEKLAQQQQNSNQQPQ